MSKIITNETIEELKPLKVIIHGPPASGKTKLAERLCQHYGAHYISVKTMIEETLEELHQNIERENEKIRLKAKKVAKEKKDEDEEDEDDEEDEEIEEEDEVNVDVEDWQEQIKDIMTLIDKSENKRLPDEYVVRLMKSFLAKELCQTRGYVLDGFPKTIEQAKEIFGQAAEGGNQEEGGKIGVEVPGEGGAGEDGTEAKQVGSLIGNASDKIIPDYVISLEATDEFLCERVMKLPQRLIQGTHYDEVNMLRRLAEFRENNNEEKSVLNFFDEVGIHPYLVSLVDEETQEERNLDCIFDFVCGIFGKPIPGFGLTAEEEDTIRKLEMEQRRLLEEEGRIEKRLLEEKAEKEHQEKMEKWTETFEMLQKEEEKILIAQSEPQRSYLMKYIFPTLSKGLIEVAKMKPEDPVDFLAEFLFRENPEGKMFDPSYTRKGEKILKQCEEIQPTLEQARSSM
ncbi:adenylate kinase 7 [Leptinotarsa decemlineata]|uniref:adenylate kinase 7 n=1 Tax=Leptinotarsa decemlineata TaxID=7539 RepID=UPI003D30462B